MLRNVKQAWWRAMVQMRSDIVGLTPRSSAARHLGRVGPLRDVHRPVGGLQEVQRALARGQDRRRLSELRLYRVHRTRAFNLMFKTQAGPVEGEGATAYLRPETAQGIFTNFANVLSTVRKKPPFGIAQIASPFATRSRRRTSSFAPRVRADGDGVLRPPADAEQWYRYWIETRSPGTSTWVSRRATPFARARQEDLSHYSRVRPTWSSPIRGAGTNSRASPIAATTTDPARQRLGRRARLLRSDDERALHAYVIEPAAGATRAMMAFLLAAYHETSSRARAARSCDSTGARAYQVAVLPSRRRPSWRTCRASPGLLQPHFMCDYDVTQSIGRR